MKRKYQKPYLAVEPYQLDASVAAACSVENNIPIGFYDNTCVHESGFFGNLCDNDIVQFECYHGQYGPDGMTFTYS